MKIIYRRLNMQFAYAFIFAKEKANKISLSLLFYGKKICEMNLKEIFLFTKSMKVAC